MTTTYGEDEEFVIDPITGELLKRTGEYVSEFEQYIKDDPFYDDVIDESVYGEVIDDPTDDELLYMTPFPPGDEEKEGENEFDKY